MILDETSLQRLEWHRVCHALAEHAVSEGGAERLRQTMPFARLADAQDSLALLAELAGACEEGEELPLRGFADVDDLLDTVEKSGVLEGEELLDIRRLAGALRALLAWCRSHAEVLPLQRGEFEHLATGENLRGLQELIRHLEHILDEKGEIRPNASPLLPKLRKTIQNRKTTIRSGIQRMTHDPEWRDLLEDDNYTMVGNRYVLSLKSGKRHQRAGMVHGSSGSGATVYFEPQELVGPTNEMILAQEDLAAELRRILREATRRVGELLHVMQPGLEWLRRMEERVARLRFGRRLDAVVPRLGLDERIYLPQARHPLLVLAQKPVVPNELEWPAQTGALIVSGPNAGGKTVVLKTLGLMCVMANAGLMIPAARGASLPRIDKVFVAIGDPQDLESDLSTFAAHLKDLNHYLEQGDECTLLLLDEICNGTEPLQGAALARAFLRAFAGKGLRTLVTTHYEPVKDLAAEDERFVNAAMVFNERSMEPTYRLAIGASGESRSLLIAQRMGVPEDVLHDAREHYARRDAYLVGLMERLERQEQEIGDLHASARKLEEELRAEKEQFEKERSKLHDQRERFQSKTRVEMERELRRMKNEWLEFRDSLKATGEEARMRSSLDELSRKFQKSIDRQERRVDKLRDTLDPPPPPPEKIEIGDKLWLRKLGKTGEVLQVWPDRRQAELQVGPMRLKAAFDELAPPQREDPKPPPANPAKEYLVGGLPPEPEPEIDVRGVRLEEAIRIVADRLDRAILHRMPSLRVIHGHGTGRLRDGLRRHLRQAAGVRAIEDAPPDQGGNGATVILLDS